MKVLDRYIDGLVAPFFKTDEMGQHYYFPLGVWSKGRLLPDKATADVLRQKMRKVYGRGVIAMIVAFTVINGLPNGIYWTIGLATVVAAGMSAYLLQLAAPYPRTDIDLTLREAYAAEAQSLGRGWLIALIVSSAALAIISALAAVLDTKATFSWSVPGAFMFGGAAIFFGMLARRTRT